MRASPATRGQARPRQERWRPQGPIPQRTLTFSVLSTSCHVGPDHLEVGGLGWLDWWAGWQA